MRNSTSEFLTASDLVSSSRGPCQRSLFCHLHVHILIWIAPANRQRRNRDSVRRVIQRLPNLQCRVRYFGAGGVAVNERAVVKKNVVPPNNISAGHFQRVFHKITTNPYPIIAPVAPRNLDS